MKSLRQISLYDMSCISPKDIPTTFQHLNRTNKPNRAVDMIPLGIESTWKDPQSMTLRIIAGFIGGYAGYVGYPN